MWLKCLSCKSILFSIRDDCGFAFVSDFLRAFVSFGFRLLVGSLAFVNTPTMRVLVLLLASWEAFDLKMMFSIAATIWTVGMVLGAGAIFRPLLSNDYWAG